MAHVLRCTIQHSKEYKFTDQHRSTLIKLNFISNKLKIIIYFDSFCSLDVSIFIFKVKYNNSAPQIEFLIPPAYIFKQSGIVILQDPEDMISYGSVNMQVFVVDHSLIYFLLFRFVCLIIFY
jgi:hypothetical protein